MAKYLNTILLLLCIIQGVKIGFASTQIGCPTRCTCTNNSVTCISKNLESVPYLESLTNNPVIIDLSGNEITYINIYDFSFEKSEEVKEIFLNNSNVNTIDAHAFGELTTLQELYLANNLLTSLPVDIVIENKELVLLDLSNNHFFDLPLLKSNSLEVLALANSGIMNIPEESFVYLPNLKILLLQQNNLKYVNPIVFEPLTDSFFVRLAFNPWKCDCKTVKLFNYLNARSLTEISEPIQCLNENRDFIDIYNINGPTELFERNCVISDSILNLAADANELQVFEESNEDIESEIVVKNNTSIKKQNLLKREQKEQTIDEILMGYIFVVFLACLFSLIIGILIGGLVTYRYMLPTIHRFKTESSKESLMRDI